MFKRHYISAFPLIYSMLFCLFSCTPPIPPLTESELKYNEVIEEFMQIEIIDTVNKDLKTCAISEISTAYYLPLYMGKLPKYIDLSGRKSIDLETFSERDDYSIRVNPNDFIIYVDTSRKIGMENRMYTPPPPPPPGTSNVDSYYEKHDYKHRKPTLYNSYSVFIKNNSDSILVELGYENIIDLLIEAKDSLGVWRPVQKRYSRGCGYGVKPIYLPPQYILLTACPIYSGNYKTKMRLVMNRDYLNTDSDTFPPSISNEFEGFINYSQFEHSDSTYKLRNIYCE